MHYTCAERLPILRAELDMDVVASCSVELGRYSQLGTRHSPTTKLGYRVRDLPIHHFIMVATPANGFKITTLPIHHFMIISTVVIPTSEFQTAQRFPSTFFTTFSTVAQHFPSTILRN